MIRTLVEEVGVGHTTNWSLVSPLCLDQNECFVNILPGDIKLSKEWWPAMRREGGNHFVEW